MAKNICSILMSFFIIINAFGAGNGAVTGNNQANNQAATNQTAINQQQNGLSTNQLQLQVNQYIKDQGKQTQMKAFVKSWNQDQEKNALQEINKLAKSGKLDSVQLDVVRSFFELKSIKLIRPTMVLDAILNWNANSQMGLSLVILKAVTLQNTNAKKGKALEPDAALDDILGDKDEFCRSCGC